MFLIILLRTIHNLFLSQKNSANITLNCVSLSYSQKNIISTSLTAADLCKKKNSSNSRWNLSVTKTFKLHWYFFQIWGWKMQHLFINSRIYHAGYSFIEKKKSNSSRVANQSIYSQNSYMPKAKLCLKINLRQVPEFHINKHMFKGNLTKINRVIFAKLSFCIWTKQDFHQFESRKKFVSFIVFSLI